MAETDSWPGSVTRAGAGGGTLLAFRASPGHNMAAVIQWHRDTGPALDDATLFTIRKYATTSNKVVTSQSGFDDGPENHFKDVLTHNSPT